MFNDWPVMKMTFSVNTPCWKGRSGVGEDPVLEGPFGDKLAERPLGPSRRHRVEGPPKPNTAQSFTI